MGNKLEEFKDALKALDGFVGVSEVEERGETHLVAATTQDAAAIVRFTTPSCNGIEAIAHGLGLRVGVLPFPDKKGRGVCYDIVIRSV